MKYISIVPNWHLSMGYIVIVKICTQTHIITWVSFRTWCDFTLPKRRKNPCKKMCDRQRICRNYLYHAVALAKKNYLGLLGIKLPRCVHFGLHKPFKFLTPWLSESSLCSWVHSKINALCCVCLKTKYEIPSYHGATALSTYFLYIWPFTEQYLSTISTHPWQPSSCKDIRVSLR